MEAFRAQLPRPFASQHVQAASIVLAKYLSFGRVGEAVEFWQGALRELPVNIQEDILKEAFKWFDSSEDYRARCAELRTFIGLPS